MVTFIDAHCHIDFYDDINAVIQNAVKAGVNLIINNGLNHKTNLLTLNLSQKYPQVKACLGLYPMDALKLSDKEIDEEIVFIEKNKDNIVGIGEVGVDFKLDKDNRERQKEIFRKFVKLSIKIDKPIFVHSRKAELECIEILEEENAKKVIMHCFTGKKKLAERIEKNNWFMTISTMVCYSEQIAWFARHISMSNLLCETDSPYLHPQRKENNEPAFVVEAYKKIAEVKGMDLEEVKNAVYMNWMKLM